MARIVETALGPAELEVEGTGCPVLVLHGSPGGVDGARAMSRFLRPETFKTILVSRPGYLGTPIHATDHSIDHEADLLAAVLDAVDVPRAGVLAWSGGGAAAYRLAVRHPDRVSVVVAIAAVSFRWVAPRPDAASRFLFGTGMGEHVVQFLSKHWQEQIVGGALEGEGSVRGEALKLLTKQTMAAPEQRRLVVEISRTVNIAGRRKAGWENDVANFAVIQSLELDQVSCPVLLIHGDADTDAVPEYSNFARSQLRDSQLVMMEDGTHLSFYAHPRAREVQDQAIAWFLQYHTP